MNPALLLAAAASLCYGTGDFAGGVAARRGPPIVVTAFSGLAALALLFAAFPLVPGRPGGPDLLWGVAAGVCGAAGATLIYWTLALGPVSVASPTFSLVGLVVPVVAGLAMGQHPSARAWGGVALAALAIPLLAWTGERADSPRGAHVRRTLLLSIVTGLVIGWFLVCVGRITPGSGLGPLVVGRVTAIALLAGACLVRGMRPWPPPTARAPAVAAGAFDSAANVLFMLSAQQAPLALASALVSLAPATSVVLARFLLRERWTAAQALGLLVALAAGVAISLG